LTLSIIIVNYNVKHFLEQCLYSVQKAIEGISAEVVVVDNQSADGSIEYLQPKFPNVVFIKNQQNEGFARACNRGLAGTTGAFVLFLNPDTIIAENTLSVCLRFLNNNRDCGAAGVKMIDGSGGFLKESKRSFPSPGTSLFKLLGLAALFPRSKVFARYYLGHLNENEDHEVDVLAGAFMMVRRTVLEKTGSFDERFFMYGEDIDLSYRIQKAGFKNYYLAQTTIIHFKGESTLRESLAYIKRFYEAMNLFVKKHYSGRRALLFRILVQTGIWGRALVAAAFRMVRRLLPKKECGAAGERTRLIYVASEAERQEVESFLSSGLPFEPVGCSPSFNDLDAALRQTGAHHVLLVAGGISYKDIIAYTASQEQTVKYFHAYKSSSMVCSNNSSTKGQVFTHHHKSD